MDGPRFCYVGNLCRGLGVFTEVPSILPRLDCRCLRAEFGQHMAVSVWETPQWGWFQHETNRKHPFVGPPILTHLYLDCLSQTLMGSGGPTPKSVLATPQNPGTNRSANGKSREPFTRSIHTFRIRLGSLAGRAATIARVSGRQGQLRGKC